MRSYALNNFVLSCILFMILHSALPDVVQDPFAIQVQCANSSTKDCLIISSWRRPLNSETANITHYVKYVNATSVTNATATASTQPLLSYYVVRNCDDNEQSVSLSAVNGCGEGPMQSFLPQKADDIQADAGIQVVCPNPSTGGTPNVRKGELSKDSSLQESIN